MKKKILSKLKGRAGESIAEVLIALLIAALALTMLAAVISSSSRIINRSKAKMKDYYTATNDLASAAVSEYVEKAGGAGGVNLTVKVEDDDGNETYQSLVNVYCIKEIVTGDIRVTAYKK